VGIEPSGHHSSPQYAANAVPRETTEDRREALTAGESHPLRVHPPSRIFADFTKFGRMTGTRLPSTNRFSDTISTSVAQAKLEGKEATSGTALGLSDSLQSALGCHLRSVSPRESPHDSQYSY
jgi:hypothetical protein